MTKTLSYAGVAIGALVIILLFVTSKSYLQLGAAVALYPIFAYLTLKLLPRHTEVYASPTATTTTVNNVNTVNPTFTPPVPNMTANVVLPGKVNIVDIEKRTFLKLVGTAGLSFFIFSLLGKKAEDLIFHKSSGTSSQLSLNSGVQTSGAKTISDEYKISEIDDGLISYYGFINKNGNWLIMKEDTPGNSFRYARGENDFSNNWSDRENLNYDYYDSLF